VLSLKKSDIQLWSVSAAARFSVAPSSTSTSTSTMTSDPYRYLRQVQMQQQQQLTSELDLPTTLKNRRLDTVTGVIVSFGLNQKAIKSALSVLLVTTSPDILTLVNSIIREALFTGTLLASLAKNSLALASLGYTTPAQLYDAVSMELATYAFAATPSPLFLTNTNSATTNSSNTNQIIIYITIFCGGMLCTCGLIYSLYTYCGFQKRKRRQGAAVIAPVAAAISNVNTSSSRMEIEAFNTTTTTGDNRTSGGGGDPAAMQLTKFSNRGPSEREIERKRIEEIFTAQESIRTAAALDRLNTMQHAIDCAHASMQVAERREKAAQAREDEADRILSSLSSHRNAVAGGGGGGREGVGEVESILQHVSHHSSSASASMLITRSPPRRAGGSMAVSSSRSPPHGRSVSPQRAMNAVVASQVLSGNRQSRSQNR
jgi:hypothetical protein